MCGIAGQLRYNGNAELSGIGSMCDAIRHRGPDQEGYHVSGCCGIGMRRLSIIDLGGGQQPVSNEDETVWTVFNGEIYNYRELREELIGRGHRFRTHSDTEVLVHLYEDEGTEGIQKLRGMFAYAIWDAREKSLLLVRDRFGKKPLYYAARRAGLFFASELKSLRAAGVPLGVDREALQLYFLLKLRVLDLFDELNVKATFFILGWVADYFPRVVRQIVERGHEPACHSYWHRLVYELTPEQFAKDTVQAKDAIEQAAGARVYGYRAPSFSITARCCWALDKLRELGFLYDSSIYPVHHDVYGFVGAPRGPFRLETPLGELLEFPLATFRFSRGPVLPVGGGGYLRILPRYYTRVGVQRAFNEGLTVVSYVHPWELDPEQPRLHGSLRSRLRHYTNLGQTESRLRELLTLGHFTSFRHSGLANFFPYSLLQTVGSQ